MPVRSFTPTAYFPSSPRAGNDGTLIFRMQNMILQGSGTENYAHCYGGSKDMSENIATLTLTGTLALSTSTFVVTGTGTLFTTELRPGDFVVAGTSPNHSLLVVDEIASNTSMTVCRKPNATASGVSGSLLPRIWEMNKKRATALRGNAVEFDLGTILGVGAGTLRLNGAALSASFTLSNSPKIAINSSGTYSIYTLGMATPGTLTAAAVAGTGKNMQAGVYSARVVPARQATLGYNNPSNKAEVTLTAGQRIQLTVPAADTTNGQDAWMIFVSLYTQSGGINGPWYRYELPAVYVRVGSGGGEIPAAGGTYNIEYNDAEISGNDLLSFNNDAPPKASHIGVVGGIPVWIGCQGPGASEPGPFVAPAKQNNIEAAPSGLYVSASPPDTIVGFSPGAQGRLYLLCTNSLQIAVATQAQDPRIPPIAVRPFWRSGFKHNDQLIFIGETLVGATNNGLARSASDGDESTVEYNFAVPVNELVLPFNPGHMLLAHDPRNNAVCLFMSGYNLASNGFWTTRVLMFGLRENKWIGDVLLTSTTGDMLVSGVATVGDQLYFLAGGRELGGTTTVRTYRWDDESADVNVTWSIAWQFSDWGSEDRPKHIGPFFSVVGRFSTAALAAIYANQPGQEIPTAALEANTTGGMSGGISLAPSTEVTEYNETQLNCDNAKQIAVAISGMLAFDSQQRDRIDEVKFEAYPQGARR